MAKFSLEFKKEVSEKYLGVPRPSPPKVPPSLDNKLNFIEKEMHF